MKKNSIKKIAFIFIAGLLLVSAVYFPIYPGQAALKKQLSICSSFQMYYKPAAARSHVKVSSNLYLYLGSVKSPQSAMLVYPLFVTREGFLWHAFCPGTENGQFKPLNASPGDQGQMWFSVIDSYVGQVGQYTVVSLGNEYLEACEVDPYEVYDSLGTKPLVLSCQCVGLEENDGIWASFSDGRAFSQSRPMSGGGLGGVGCLLCVENMPDDYHLFVGSKVLTKTDLQGT